MATKKRLIDANDVMERADDVAFMGYLAESRKHQFVDLISAIVSSAKTVDAVPVVRGQWVDRYGGKYDNQLFECSECKRKALCEVKVDDLGHEHIVQVLSDFCPHCGIDMRGDDND